MDRLYGCCCGVDVHKKMIVACVRKGNKRTMQSFNTTTSELTECARWLEEMAVEMVAMESTGSYWKPVYNILEFHNIPAIVVNAAHMKAVPGRKTDKKDAEWIADLLVHGLLQASFIPDRTHRELREMLAYRKSLAQQYADWKNRLQKVFEGGNLKLGDFISDVNGKSGQALLEEMLKGGAPSAERIRELQQSKVVSKRLKSSPEELAEALNGVFTGPQKRLIEMIRSQLSFTEKAIKEADEVIDAMLNSEEKKAAKALKTVPGVGEDTAKTIVGIIGTDMSRFPSANHLASWAGLAPGNNESAGKRKHGRTRKGNKTLKSALTVAAHSAIKAPGFLKAKYNRLVGHMGKKKAIIAIAHALIKIVWRLLALGEVYQDLGEDYYIKKDSTRKQAYYINQLRRLGLEVTAVPVASA